VTLRRVVSGGQTGVDRAALDAATECGLAVGGWCPKNRRAEDGFVPHRYPLQETPSSKYPQRTQWNVRDSDGTLVVAMGGLDGGSKLTVDLATRWGRPCLVVDLEPFHYGAAESAIEFIEREAIAVLNVAGPRQSRRPGIYAKAHAYLLDVFRGDDGLPILVVRDRPPGGSESAKP